MYILYNEPHKVDDFKHLLQTPPAHAPPVTSMYICNLNYFYIFVSKKNIKKIK